MGGLLVTSMAWVASLACLALVAWRFVVSSSPRRWSVLVAGTGLVVLAGVNAVVAALMLGPWTGTDGTLTHGEAWFLMAGALNIGAVVVGAALLHGRPVPPSRVGGGTPAVVRLLDDVPAKERQLLRREDDLLQRTVAAKMAIELDEPQVALDALEPVIRFLSSSVTRSLRGELSPRSSALP